MDDFNSDDDDSIIPASQEISPSWQHRKFNQSQQKSSQLSSINRSQSDTTKPNLSQLSLSQKLKRDDSFLVPNTPVSYSLSAKRNETINTIIPETEEFDGNVIIPETQECFLIIPDTEETQTVCDSQAIPFYDLLDIHGHAYFVDKQEESNVPINDDNDSTDCEEADELQDDIINQVVNETNDDGDSTDCEEELRALESSNVNEVQIENSSDELIDEQLLKVVEHEEKSYMENKEIDGTVTSNNNNNNNASPNKLGAEPKNDAETTLTDQIDNKLRDHEFEAETLTKSESIITEEKIKLEHVLTDFEKSIFMDDDDDENIFFQETQLFLPPPLDKTLPEEVNITVENVKLVENNSSKPIPESTTNEMFASSQPLPEIELKLDAEVSKNCSKSISEVASTSKEIHTQSLLSVPDITQHNKDIELESAANKDGEEDDIFEMDTQVFINSVLDEFDQPTQKSIPPIIDTACSSKKSNDIENIQSNDIVFKTPFITSAPRKKVMKSNEKQLTKEIEDDNIFEMCTQKFDTSNIFDQPTQQFTIMPNFEEIPKEAIIPDVAENKKIPKEAIIPDVAENNLDEETQLFEVDPEIFLKRNNLQRPKPRSRFLDRTPSEDNDVNTNGNDDVEDNIYNICTQKFVIDDDLQPRAIVRCSKRLLRKSREDDMESGPVDKRIKEEKLSPVKLLKELKTPVKLIREENVLKMNRLENISPAKVPITIEKSTSSKRSSSRTPIFTEKKLEQLKHTSVKKSKTISATSDKVDSTPSSRNSTSKRARDIKASTSAEKQKVKTEKESRLAKEEQTSKGKKTVSEFHKDDHKVSSKERSTIKEETRQERLAKEEPSSKSKKSVSELCEDDHRSSRKNRLAKKEESRQERLPKKEPTSKSKKLTSELHKEEHRPSRKERSAKKEESFGERLPKVEPKPTRELLKEEHRSSRKEGSAIKEVFSPKKKVLKSETSSPVCKESSSATKPSPSFKISPEKKILKPLEQPSTVSTNEIEDDEDNLINYSEFNSQLFNEMDENEDLQKLLHNDKMVSEIDTSNRIVKDVDLKNLRKAENIHSKKRCKSPSPTSETSSKLVKKNEIKPKSSDVKTVKSSEHPRASIENSKQRSLRVKRGYRICTTKLKTAINEDAVQKLGGEIVDDIMNATILVAGTATRTEKFLCALMMGIPIVNFNWIHESVKAKSFLTPKLYIMKDDLIEKKNQFCLETSLRKARNRSFFKNYTILSTPSTNMPIKVFEKIVKCGGGIYIPVNLKSKPLRIQTEFCLLVIDNKKKDLPVLSKVYREYKDVDDMTEDSFTLAILRQQL